MKCKNDNAQTLQMAGPYAFGCTIRRESTLNSLIRDRLGDTTNLKERFRMRIYTNDATYQEEAAR